MKSSHPAMPHATTPVLDVHHPEHAAKLGEAFFKERQNVLAALEELVAMGYADSGLREKTALATMEPMPAHMLMERAPREVLKLRAALFLVSCHAHRSN